MTEERAEPMHDGKTETEAAASFPRGVVDLMVLFEYRLEMIVRIPISVSQNSMLNFPWCRRQPSRTLPCLVYFKAFESRFRIICSSRRGSLLTNRLHGTTRRASPWPARDR